MIAPENKEVLDWISNTLLSLPPLSNRDIIFEKEYILKRVENAIKSSTDTDAAIEYILTYHSNLIGSLVEVVKLNYPEKLADVEKLAVLA